MSTKDTAAQPLRKKIEEWQIDEWRNEAHTLFRHGNREAVVVQYLTERGCPPRIRDLVIAHARAAGRTHHRGAGLKALGIGGALCLGGALACWFGFSGVPMGGYLLHSGKLVWVGLGAIAAGAMPLGLGLFKTLTGSDVEVEVPEV